MAASLMSFQAGKAQRLQWTCRAHQSACRAEAAPAVVHELVRSCHCSCPQCYPLSFSSAAILLAAAEHIAMIVIGRVLQGIAVSGNHLQLFPSPKTALGWLRTLFYCALHLSLLRSCVRLSCKRVP